MKRLIVTADDVGLHPGMTEGAIRAHREGIVTACSVVACGAHFEEAVKRLREVATLEVGVHLTLVGERPLTAIEMPGKYTSFLPRYLARRITITQIERELRAQVEKLAATGLTLTHINSHQHLHLMPRIFTIVLRLATEFRIGYVRVIDDHGGRAALARRAGVGSLSVLGRLARRRAPRCNDRTIGVLEAGHIQHVERLLGHVDGLTELVTHPGIGVGGYDWDYEWEGEMGALCDPGLRKALSARSVQLIAPSQA